MKTPAKPQPPANKLSKSRYTRGIQCYKSLWLLTHSPEMRVEYDAAALSRFRTGHEVGELARNLYPNGVLVQHEGLSFDEQVKMTSETMKKAKVIYEAAFSYTGIFIRADILRKGRSGWEIYEVKSSNDTKDIHQDDIDIQYFVLDSLGIPVSKSCIVHLNRKYVRDGNIKLNDLFSIKNVTRTTRDRQADVKKEVGRMLRMLKGKEPNIDIGRHCHYPYACDFIDYCWQHIPENSVFDLAGKGVNKFDLYRQGIILQEDIPREILKGKQLQQVETFLKKKTAVNKYKLRTFLDTLWHPLCFLDFETFQYAIPPYNGLSPYQSVTFQYSLHYRKKAGGKLHHREYLAEPGIDPRKEFLDRLLDDIPDNACILVYNKSFEVGRLKELAQHFPRKKKKLQAIIDNIVDLIEPFRQRSIYSWKQKGSHSIKAVLPAFVPGMTYEGMEIGNGEDAMEAYHEMCRLLDRPKELAKLRKAMLEYCKQDTLAMVKLLEVLGTKAL